MRQMFDLLAVVGVQMSEYFKNVSPEDRVIEIKDTVSRFALDVIATTNFGLEVNSLRDRDNKFYEKIRGILNFQSLSTNIKLALFLAAPKLAKLLRISFISPEKYQFFLDLINNTQEARKRENIYRPDLINLLMELKKGGSLQAEESSPTDDAGFATVEESDLGKKVSNRQWTDDELNAQAFIFLFAGFEAVSTAISFITHELAINPDIQQKLIDEIDTVDSDLQGKNLNYETLQKMKYLDQVVSEGLRFWTISDITDRVCNKDYTLEVEEGKTILIKKGSVVWFPFVAFHLSEEYYENADKFDPERFSDENKHRIDPSAYLPFGVGPRNCIGSRFALMEVKAALYYLLLNFRLEVTGKTQIPLKVQKGFGKVPAKGVWLKLAPRK